MRGFGQKDRHKDRPIGTWAELREHRLVAEEAKATHGNKGQEVSVHWRRRANLDGVVLPERYDEESGTRQLSSIFFRYIHKTKKSRWVHEGERELLTSAVDASRRLRRRARKDNTTKRRGHKHTPPLGTQTLEPFTGKGTCLLLVTFYRFCVLSCTLGLFRTRRPAGALPTSTPPPSPSLSTSPVVLSSVFHAIQMFA